MRMASDMGMSILTFWFLLWAVVMLNVEWVCVYLKIVRLVVNDVLLIGRLFLIARARFVGEFDWGLRGGLFGFV